MKPCRTFSLSHVAFLPLFLASCLLFLFVGHREALAAPGDIVTIAGGGAGDGNPALSVPVSDGYAVTYDLSGNLFIADCGLNRVRKVDLSGIITTVAGVGGAGFSGDGGPAVEAALFCPSGVVVDNSGNLFISDQYNQRIRKVSASGVITTIAGTGTAGFSGDGGSATAANLNRPLGLAVDATDSIYFADNANNRVRKIDSSGVISTVAGNGSAGNYYADGGNAVQANLYSPTAVTVDTNGNLYIAVVSNHRVHKVNTFGVISTLAGNGVGGYGGDNGTATAAMLLFPSGVQVDGSGNVYIADMGNHRVRKVNASGVISTIAGTGISGYSGDGSAATSAKLNHPNAVTIDNSGNPVILDEYNHRIRLVDSSGIISTIAGSGAFGFYGEGVSATTAALLTPAGVTIDKSGNIYIADTNNSRVRKVDADGVITTFAGNESYGYSGDGGPATLAKLNTPYGVAADDDGNLYVVDSSYSRIRKIDTAGMISTAAGIGTYGYSGDDGPATAASFNNVFRVAADAVGNVFVADKDNHRIRKIDSSGVITTIAGTGVAGYSGDGGSALAAEIQGPFGIVSDISGNIYFSDTGNQRIRKIDSAGIISTIAGTGTAGYSGDGDNALVANINSPNGIALDATGNLYFADTLNHRIRKIDVAGIITTVAGNGVYGFSGDNGAATSASLYYPKDVAIDPSGNILIADTYNDRIRKVFAVNLPSGSVIINSRSAYTDNVSVDLTLFCTSQSGNCIEMQLSTNAVDWTAPETYSTSRAWTLSTGDGIKRVYAKFKDEAGMWSYPYNASIILDTTPPVITITSPQTYSNSATPLFLFALNEGTATVKVDGVEVNKVSGSYLDALMDGPHLLQIEATDAVGNTDFSDLGFTVDTSVPTVTLISPTSGLTNVNNQLLDYGVSEGNVVVKVDGVVVNKVSGDYLTTLADGPRTVRVEAIDPAGNIGFAEETIIVDTTPPTIMPPRVIAGDSYNFILTPQGLLWGWGANFYGQIGDGTTNDYLIPVKFSGSSTWATINGGYAHTAALRSDGTIWTWGYNGYGQLGGGTTGGSRSIPAQVGTTNTWITVSSGFSHVVALNSDGSLWAWGSSTVGQLGDGTTTGKSVPTRIGTDNDWIHVVAGGNHTIAVKKDGSLWAWGRNNRGQLGDGTTVDRPSPVKIGQDLYTSIVPDSNRTFALKMDGTLWAWGDNGLGSLGDGTTTNRLTPVQIGSNVEWSAISTGDAHTVALKKDGTLWTWGYNNYGQLGDDTSYYRAMPAQIGTDATWVAVTVGGSHNIAMKSDGTVWGWGYNINGELGNGTSVNASRPIQVQMDQVMGSENKFVINGGRRFSNTVTVDLHLAASDASDIAGMQFSNDGITWTSTEPYAQSQTWTLNSGDGKKTVYVKVKDHAENWSLAQSATIVLDTIAPAVAITSPEEGALINTVSPVLSFSVSDGTVTVKVDGNVVSKLSGSTLAPLTEGAHTVRVEALDAAGNIGVDEVSFTVDVPPTVSITSPAIGSSNNIAPLLIYSVSNGTVVVKLDGVVVNLLSGNALGPLADGLHTVRVEATDTGGTGFAERTFTVDTVAPTVTITAPATGTTADSQPLLTYTVSDGVVTVKVDGIIVSKVSGSRLSTLANGAHTVRVESQDAAGNIGFAVVSFTVNATTSPTFSDDMETGIQKWESASGLWHIVTSPATYAISHGGARSWWYGQDDTGNFNNGASNSGAIISVPFTVPTNGQLSYWSWEQTESSITYDTRKVYISTNNGATWIQLFQSLDNTAVWHQVNVNLAAYTGMSAKLKFEFNTVDFAANTYRGWYVDDVTVTGSTPPPSGTQNEGFETANFTSLPWVMSGNGSWVVTSLVKHGGLYAAKAATITHSQTSAIQTNVNCAAGNMSFWYSVSSESNYDFLTLYVDGVQKGRWSGTVGWTQATVPVTAGVHAFKWIYSKDGSVSTGSDTAWVDDLVFPVPLP